MDQEEIYQFKYFKNLSVEDTAQYSNKLNLDLSKNEVDSFTKLINNSLNSFSHVFQKEEMKNIAKYPRLIVQNKNPYGGFSSQCVIKGESEGILKGKSFVIKDSILVAGVPLTCGSELITGTIPDEDATVVKRILENGGDIVGKSVCEDLSFSLNSFTSCSGIPINPVDPTVTCGGSSSGSAVLVAGGIVDIGIGTDAGGSIRIPAASCKVIGFKPTYGLIPITGAFGLEATLDHIGPIAKNIKDVALFMNATAGPDEYDQRYYTYLKNSIFSIENVQYIEKKTSWEIKSEIYYGISRINIDFIEAYNNYRELIEGINEFPLRIGIYDEAVNMCDYNIKINFMEKFLPILTHDLRKHKARIEKFNYEEYDLINKVFFSIVTLGFYDFVMVNDNSLINSFNRYNTNICKITHSNKITNSRDLGHTNKFSLILSDYIKDKYGNKLYTHANNLRKDLFNLWEKLFEKFDLILLPTITHNPPHLPKNDISVEHYINESLKNKNNTCIFNLFGYPALTMEGSKENNPKSFCPVMIVGKHFEDHRVIQFGRYIENLLKE
jgi:amidase